ncbi:hypothetical protein [Streptomyces sp. NPDC055140]
MAHRDDRTGVLGRGRRAPDAGWSAGHAALAAAWLRLVAWPVLALTRNTGEFGQC